MDLFVYIVLYVRERESLLLSILILFVRLNRVGDARPFIPVRDGFR